MRILCVCKGNMCRSVMAEHVVRRMLKAMGMVAHVESAGIKQEVGNPACRDTEHVMTEAGMCIAAHRSRWAGDLDLQSFDLILCMERSHIAQLCQWGAPRHAIRLLNSRSNGITNPFGHGTSRARRCRNIIMRSVAQQLAREFLRSGRLTEREPYRNHTPLRIPA